MIKAVFIDKDGTLIKNVPYNVNPAKIELYTGAGKSLALLKQHGYKLFVITNQPGIAKKYFEENALAESFEAIQLMLGECDVTIDDFYYCPHNDTDTCSCRKPKPGLLQQAARDNNIDLAASWMIGDILNDAEAGNAAGCRSILFDNGNETEWLMNDERRPYSIVTSLYEAAKLIITTDEQGL